MRTTSWTIPLPGAPAPSEALRRLRGLPHRVLLETADGEGRSFLAADPVAVLTSRGGRSHGVGSLAGIEALQGMDPFEALEHLLRLPGVGGTPGSDVDPGGGCFGYLAYEAGDVLERLPPPQPDEGPALPSSWFGVFPWTVVWQGGRCELRARLLPGIEGERLESEVERVHATVLGSRGAEPREPPGTELGHRLRTGASAPDSCAPAPPHPGSGGSLRRRGSPQIRGVPLSAGSDALSSMGRQRFRAGVERIQEYIRAGDLFQANLTHRILRPTSMDGETLLARLRKESPAPYLAYLDTGAGEVVSISPESFLSLRRGTVVTRPIKGTAPRGRTPADDRRLAMRLSGSEKDRAENVMIVDLLRNDLSRVCRDGSVTVPELFRLESHPTVHHLVSTVRGELRAGTGVVDLLRATFPGGSITGAPKIRAIEILRELEPVRRGVYTGALGMLTFEGDAELSIAIRTTVLRDGVAAYGTGGGITLASDPDAEWEETLDKAAAFIRATDP